MGPGEDKVDAGETDAKDQADDLAEEQIHEEKTSNRHRQDDANGRRCAQYSEPRCKLRQTVGLRSDRGQEKSGGTAAFCTTLALDVSISRSWIISISSGVAGERLQVLPMTYVQRRLFIHCAASTFLRRRRDTTVFRGAITANQANAVNCMTRIDARRAALDLLAG